MTEHSLWRFSRALHGAINDRQFEDLAALIDDDVDWALYGPIDMFPFMGARHGKRAVLEVIRQLADNFHDARDDSGLDHREAEDLVGLAENDRERDPIEKAD